MAYKDKNDIRVFCIFANIFDNVALKINDTIRVHADNKIIIILDNNIRY